MRVIIACAGTGGHINPGIAIANKIMMEETESVIKFIGSKTGLENELVAKAGYEINSIRSGKFNRKMNLKNIKNNVINLVNTVLGVKDAKTILKEFNPDIVIGTGGYICVPVMKATYKLKLPFVLHESNAFPGVAVKIYANKASKVLLGFDSAKKYIPKANAVCTGTPAKFDVDVMDKLDLDSCKKELGLDKINKKIIFVTGGSQGARKFNNVIINMVKKYQPKEFFVVIATGKNNYEDVLNSVTSDISQYIKVESFIYDMEKMYKASDLLITRAGAMTVTELSIAGKPAILIPLPTAAENHQLYNALTLEKGNAGKVIEEKNLTEDMLYSQIMELISDDSKLKSMGKNSRGLYKSGVEDRIYNEIKKVTSNDDKCHQIDNK